ncbi:DNA-binding MarR family transcriptional regulator [Sphingomonas kaistensis]|uniref:DNA-binding MarR family transcriptional regulator n=1 Tax=Sphingomonas kaistensis TaxID=298708 RepID=A0A7X5Y7R3_9SPHN|nr:winged helix DNA-binding protein [Sphingomonas kaistensis]NJC05455.1 DNA-binding MarR family transcriptional regulator [Sphingomonas kaistensis]
MSYQRTDKNLLFGREDGSVVALSAEETALARSILSKLVTSIVSLSADPAAAVRREQSAVELARSVHHARRRRSEHFGPVLFSEPAWDMLLVLFIYGNRNEERLSVTRLAEYGDAQLTTAIRWLDYLESQRLIVRQQCEVDRRKYFVELSERGRTMMVSYFESLIDTL